MKLFVQEFHSGWAYVVIATGVFLFALLLIYMLQKKEVTPFIKKISFYTTLAFHIQLLVGLVYYFFYSDLIKLAMDDPAKAMGDTTTRQAFVEHPLMMIAAVVFITLVNAKIKRVEYIRFPLVIMSFLALVCILAMIPWAQWP